ncbi:MAG: thioredoxin family protein [Ignavibacteriaceae bacterium]
MQKIISIQFIIILVMAVPLLFAQTKKKNNKTVKSKITFVELGSVNCIPCKMMQPVMKTIEKKYGGQVKVIFYDVWTLEQKHYAQKYGIRLIPTQVFLDAAGKEFHRHEGFYPEEEINKILESKGLKSNNKEE